MNTKSIVMMSATGAVGSEIVRGLMSLTEIIEKTVKFTLGALLLMTLRQTIYAKKLSIFSAVDDFYSDKLLWAESSNHSCCLANSWQVDDWLYGSVSRR